MRDLLSRKVLAIYLWCLAGYELSLALYFWRIENGPPPLLADPRWAMAWLFASINSHFLLPPLLSAIWLCGIGLGLLRYRSLLWIYAIVEAIIAFPAVILMAILLSGSAGHLAASGSDAGIAITVLVLFTALPVSVAFRLAMHEKK